MEKLTIVYTNGRQHNERAGQIEVEDENEKHLTFSLNRYQHVGGSVRMSTTSNIRISRSEILGFSLKSGDTTITKCLVPSRKGELLRILGNRAA